MAVNNQHEKLVQLLIDNGANINHTATNISALGLAVRHGNLDLVKILVTNGADLSYGVCNLNAIDQAKQASQKHIYDYLTQFQPTIQNKTKKTPLLFFQDINTVEMQELIANRHNSTETQRGYDKPYGS